MRYVIGLVIILAVAWGALLGVASLQPRAGEFILLRSDARPAFYAAHPELSTEIVFWGGGILVYRALSED